MMELLNGHKRTCYELFQMDKTTFFSFALLKKETRHLKETQEVMIEETRAIAYCFNILCIQF